ncbi:hypothetical protein HK099_002989, partial [Clydaea vesicula]
EPVFNVGDELQAINRVHRIGQSKETFVHRYIMKDTVEQKIFASNKIKTKIYFQNGGDMKEIHCKSKQLLKNYEENLSDEDLINVYFDS